MMEQLKVAVTPEIFVRLVTARASSKDVITVAEASKCQAFVEFYPDSSLVHKQWNGEGLPPIGTVCEFSDGTGGEWRKVEVMYLSKHTILVKFDGSPSEDVEGAYSPEESNYFRPIRTAEQIAAEERKKAIESMSLCCPNNDWVTTTETCAALYDAGYRKTDVQ